MMTAFQLRCLKFRGQEPNNQILTSIVSFEAINFVTCPDEQRRGFPHGWPLLSNSKIALCLSLNRNHIACAKTLPLKGLL